MSPERLQFLTKLKARNYSTTTIVNYEHALVKLSEHYNKSPLAMTTEEIERYVLYKREHEMAAPATINLHSGAFKSFFFLYSATFDRYERHRCGERR